MDEYQTICMNMPALYVPILYVVYFVHTSWIKKTVWFFSSELKLLFRIPVSTKNLGKLS